VGNPDTSHDVAVTINVPLAQMGLAGHDQYRLTDLWTDEQQVVTGSDLEQLKIEVKRDKTIGGGLGLLKIEPLLFN
jgi:hypothetical protein